MRTVRDTRRHADRLVGDSAARRFRFFLSVSETWKSATVGWDGSARSIGVAVVVAASSAGHSGAASATWEHVHRHFAVAALFVTRTPHIPLAGQRSTRMSILTRRQHGGITSPSCCRQVGASPAATTERFRKVHSELFRVKLLREIPQWWILGRCGPPNCGAAAHGASGGAPAPAQSFCSRETNFGQHNYLYRTTPPSLDYAVRMHVDGVAERRHRVPQQHKDVEDVVRAPGRSYSQLEA